MASSQGCCIETGVTVLLDPKTAWEGAKLRVLPTYRRIVLTLRTFQAPVP